jgi:hypothetical protein
LTRSQLDTGAGLLWCVGAGIALEALFAAVGRAARRGPLWLACLLPAALAVEALALLAGAIDGESAELRFTGQPGAVAVLVGELLLAAVLVLLLRDADQPTAR